MAHLEVEVVLAVLVELGRGDVETDLDLASVAGLLDGLGKELKGLLGTGDVGGESALVTDVASWGQWCSISLFCDSPSLPNFLAMTFLRTW